MSLLSSAGKLLVKGAKAAIKFIAPPVDILAKEGLKPAAKKLVIKTPALPTIAAAPAKQGIVSKAAEAYTTALVKSPFKTAAKTAVVAGATIPFTAGLLSTNPSLPIDVVKYSAEKGKAAGKFLGEKGPSAEALVGGVALAAGVGGLAYGAKQVYDYFADDKGASALPSDKGTPSPPLAAPALTSAGALPSAPVPVTAQTQVLGREAGAVSRRRRRARKAAEAPRASQNVRVNILNATQSRLQTANYLSKRHLR